MSMMMRRHRRARRRSVLLSVLTHVLMAMILFYAYHLIAGEVAKAAGPRRLPGKVAHPPPPGHTSTPGKPQPDSYTVIARRNLFQPLAAPKVTRAPQPAPSSLEAAIVHPPAPKQAPPDSLPLLIPPTEEVYPFLPDEIAVVGFVKAGDERYVLVEDVATGETSFVRVGGTVFDYTVNTADADKVVLERDGERFTIAIGESKVILPMQ